MSALKISEIFESVQGEGVSAGAPALFLRLALCNLCCRWCDTKYTWDFTSHRYQDEVHPVQVGEVLARILACAPARLIITGGEPLLQQRALAELVIALPHELVIEVETNGTFAPSDTLAARVNQWNVSPKLESSAIPERRRLRQDALVSLRDTGRAFLKLVIDGEDDLAQADALVSRLAWSKERVLLMPQARTRAELRERSAFVIAASQSRGFGFSPRLHVERWDGRRGA